MQGAPGEDTTQGRTTDDALLVVHPTDTQDADTQDAVAP
jgi:hypothetical protein